MNMYINAHTLTDNSNLNFGRCLEQYIFDNVA